MRNKTPEGDLFVIRNIGNQIATSRGSVQYGVNHLGYSLLLIVGAVYDFANDMKKGAAGKLDIININGETDPAKLRNRLELAAKSDRTR